MARLRRYDAKGRTLSRISERSGGLVPLRPRAEAKRAVTGVEETKERTWKGTSSWCVLGYRFVLNSFPDMTRSIAFVRRIETGDLLLFLMSRWHAAIEAQAMALA